VCVPICLCSDRAVCVCERSASVQDSCAALAVTMTAPVGVPCIAYLTTQFVVMDCFVCTQRNIFKQNSTLKMQ
jgi:hypothetical protein